MRGMLAKLHRIPQRPKLWDGHTAERCVHAGHCPSRLRRDGGVRKPVCGKGVDSSSPTHLCPTDTPQAGISLFPPCHFLHSSSPRESFGPMEKGSDLVSPVSAQTRDERREARTKNLPFSTCHFVRRTPLEKDPESFRWTKRSPQHHRPP